MVKTFLKLTTIAMCALLILGALSACGPKNLTGTWDNADYDKMFVNFDEDGSAAGYNAEYDMVSFGGWTEKKGSFEITGLLSDEPLIFKLKGKDTLYCAEYEITLKKGADKEIPAITEDELTDDTWISEDGVYELEFYYDGDWDLYDDDEWEYITEGTYTLVKGNLIMKAEDGTTYKPTIADNRRELTLDGMVFFREG